MLPLVVSSMETLYKRSHTHFCALEAFKAKGLCVSSRTMWESPKKTFRCACYCIANRRGELR